MQLQQQQAQPASQRSAQLEVERRRQKQLQQRQAQLAAQRAAQQEAERRRQMQLKQQQVHQAAQVAAQQQTQRQLQMPVEVQGREAAGTREMLGRLPSKAVPALRVKRSGGESAILRRMLDLAEQQKVAELEAERLFELEKLSSMREQQAKLRLLQEAIEMTRQQLGKQKDALRGKDRSFCNLQVTSEGRVGHLSLSSQPHLQSYVSPYVSNGNRRLLSISENQRMQPVTQQGKSKITSLAGKAKELSRLVGYLYTLNDLFAFV
uniref:Myb_CC_LHEQLE domain-containing protein n=1 Tax=Ascaris lumbricoides TaxID=6252 RepID=A0A0M3IHZ3_ASCLU